MRYHKLGRSGLLVSELCLGTMTFGGGDDMWGKIGQVQQDDVNKIVKGALDAGINFIDTANVYHHGESEKLLGNSLKSLGIPRDDVVIATKVLGQMGEGPNGRGASRAHILSQVKQSLKRLQLDHIDLYQLHGWDATTPIEETIEAFDQLVRDGLVRYVGLSNWAAWQVMKAKGIIDARHLSPVVSLQSYYTIAGRDLEREIVPMLLSEEIGLMVWSPLAGGLLSGKYTRDDEASGDGRRAQFDFPPVNRDRAYDIIDAMQPMAKARGCSVARIALAWLLHQKVVTTVIIGAKRMDQLQDNIAATEVKLSDEELATLNEVSKLPAEYPGWMIERQGDARQPPAKEAVLRRVA